MNTWNTIVVVACALLLVFLCRKEWLRRNRARLVWRLLASAAAVVCLACMALPLKVTENKKGSGAELIVATEGANPDSVRYFKHNVKTNAEIIEKDHFLYENKKHYDRVHVFGYGFTEEELGSVEPAEIVFHPSAIKTGITAVNWKRQVKKGEPLLIQGTYVNETALPVTLLLRGFDTVADSLVIPARRLQPFHLRTVPKQNGKAVFSILALQGKDTLEKEPIPVEVSQTTPLKIMILSAAPDFENKFLKDWLSQNGYGVIIKTNISTNKFDRLVLNTTEKTIDRFTPSLLDSLDVLVSDETALSALPASEKDLLYRQVSTKGMGLVIRGDSITSREWFTKRFHLFGLAGKSPTQLSLSLLQAENVKTVLPVEQPQFIRLQNGMQSLATDSAGNTVAAAVSMGAGKIIFSTLDNTYSWLLAGNQPGYYALWNLLLQKASRKNKAAHAFETVPALPLVNSPVTVQVEMMRDTFPVAHMGSSTLALAQDPIIPYRWQAGWWPAQAGWQPPLVVANESYNWYVYNKDDWRYIRAGERKTAMDRYIVSQKKQANTMAAAGETEEKPVSLFLFFLPFIICSGFLWLERKIS